ncbi:hypothetical protein B0T20DRAFT_395413 [Sordaria brevicollis]|uniref:Uncharacterized protein n=1 Tax=Sordaria brevicollis TaxID=83679 RepID=A0AAE0P8Z6_SORBR|nr:hypothetical protein B0T20DRAFT_395413 [Sordaria brevicollis]
MDHDTYPVSSPTVPPGHPATRPPGIIQPAAGPGQNTTTQYNHLRDPGPLTGAAERPGQISVSLQPPSPRRRERLAVFGLWLAPYGDGEANQPLQDYLANPSFINIIQSHGQGFQSHISTSSLRALGLLEARIIMIWGISISDYELVQTFITFTDWNQTEPNRAEQHIKSLARAGYKILYEAAEERSKGRRQPDQVQVFLTVQLVYEKEGGRLVWLEEIQNGASHVDRKKGKCGRVSGSWSGRVSPKKRCDEERRGEGTQRNATRSGLNNDPGDHDMTKPGTGKRTRARTTHQLLQPAKNGRRGSSLVRPRSSTNSLYARQGRKGWEVERLWKFGTRARQRTAQRSQKLPITAVTSAAGGRTNPDRRPRPRTAFGRYESSSENRGTEHQGSKNKANEKHQMFKRGQEAVRGSVRGNMGETHTKGRAGQIARPVTVPVSNCQPSQPSRTKRSSVTNRKS